MTHCVICIPHRRFSGPLCTNEHFEFLWSFFFKRCFTPWIHINGHRNCLASKHESCSRAGQCFAFPDDSVLQNADTSNSTCDSCIPTGPSIAWSFVWCTFRKRYCPWSSEILIICWHDSPALWFTGKILLLLLIPTECNTVMLSSLCTRIICLITLPPKEFSASYESVGFNSWTRKIRSYYFVNGWTAQIKHQFHELITFVTSYVLRWSTVYQRSRYLTYLTAISCSGWLKFLIYLYGKMYLIRPISLMRRTQHWLVSFYQKMQWL